MKECINCGSSFQKKSNESKSFFTKRKFCSRKCSVTYSNKNNPKRRVEGNCLICRTPIHAHLKYCTECKASLKKDPSIEVQEKRAKDLIHIDSRRVTANRKKCCAKCGYSVHVQVCHIKPIRDFDKDATKEEINHPDNLILLCPNHHWEFDHGMLTL